MFKLGNIVKIKNEHISVLYNEYSDEYHNAMSIAIKDNFVILNNRGFNNTHYQNLFEILSNKNDIVLAVYENEIELDIVYYRQLKLKKLLEC